MRSCANTVCPAWRRASSTATISCGRRGSGSPTSPPRRTPTPARSTGSHRSPRRSPARRSCSCATRDGSTSTTPRSTHLPELRAAQSPFGAIETITIRRMLSHESGLKGEPPDTDWSAAPIRGPPAAESRQRGRVRHPGSAEHPEQVLESRLPVARRDRDARVGRGLRRLRAGAHPRRRWASPRRAFDPFRRRLAAPGRDRIRRRAASATSWTPRWQFSAMEWAEGGLWSCVEDMARWVSFQLREDGGARDGAQVLAGTSLAEMHRARYLADDDWSRGLGHLVVHRTPRRRRRG